MAIFSLGGDREMDSNTTPTIPNIVSNNDLIRAIAWLDRLTMLLQALPEAAGLLITRTGPEVFCPRWKVYRKEANGDAELIGVIEPDFVQIQSTLREHDVVRYLGLKLAQIKAEYLAR